MDYGYEPERRFDWAKLDVCTPAARLLTIISAKLFNKQLCHLITFDVTGPGAADGQ